MGLTAAEVGPYLLRRDLVTPASIVAGDFFVKDASRRNTNFTTITKDGPSYLLKSARAWSRAHTVAHEARVHSLLFSRPEMSGMARYLPRNLGYDAARGVLIMEFLPHGRSLADYQERTGRFPVSIARVMGRALATLHSAGGDRDAVFLRSTPSFLRLPPWILSVHRPDLERLNSLSRAEVDILSIVQGSPDFCRLLDELRETRTTGGVIHRDLKWDNCIVFARKGSARTSRVRIVDWEMASLGDPCWDVGSFFSNYLTAWVSSMPTGADMPPAHSFELARFPLHRMQPAMESFWRSYARHRGLAEADVATRLRRSVQLCGARLLQTAHEKVQYSSQLTSEAVSLTQLALNLMRRPEDAIVHLFGMPLTPTH